MRGFVVHQHVMNGTGESAVLQQSPEWIFPSVVTDFEEDILTAGANDVIGQRGGGFVKLRPHGEVKGVARARAKEGGEGGIGGVDTNRQGGVECEESQAGDCNASS